MGRVTDALKDFDQVLNLDPDQTDVRVRRAHLRFEAGDTTGAFADLDRAVRSRPNDPTLLETRAYSYFATGDAQRAATDFNAALALRGLNDPDLIGVYHNRGLMEFDKGDYTSAINHFTLALSFGPADTPLSLAYRGQAYLAVGEPTRALADFTMLAEDPPHVVFAHEQRARALDDLGRHGEARLEELWLRMREIAGLMARPRDWREGFAIDVTLALNSHVPLLTPYWDELSLRCNLVSWTIWQHRPAVCPDKLPAPRLL